jgi:hypothetical protein
MIPAAEKSRLYRQRQKIGQIVLRVPVDEVALTEALIVSGWLPNGADPSRDQLAAFDARALELWSRGALATGNGVDRDLHL